MCATVGIIIALVFEEVQWMLKKRFQLFMQISPPPFRIVNFPHMDSNIPANPAYGVYISQLVRYGRIWTSKVDFMNRLRGLSLHLRQQGFLTNLLQRSFTKFFNRHGLIVVKYGTCKPAGDEICHPGLNSPIVSLHYLLIYYLDYFFSCILIRVRVHYLLI